jgi:hypothetical protein
VDWSQSSGGKHLKVEISLLLNKRVTVKHDAPELPFAIGLPFDNPKVLQAHRFNPAA